MKTRDCADLYSEVQKREIHDEVEAPKLMHITGGLEFTDSSVLAAPHIAMARAQAALAAAQRQAREAEESGEFKADGYTRPLRVSTRTMRSDLEAVSVSVGAPKVPTRPARRRAPA